MTVILLFHNFSLISEANGVYMNSHWCEATVTVPMQTTVVKQSRPRRPAQVRPLGGRIKPHIHLYDVFVSPPGTCDVMVALRYVMESLKKPPNNKMYLFFVVALAPPAHGAVQ